MDIVKKVKNVIGKFFQKLRAFDVDINGGIERAEVWPRSFFFMATLSLVTLQMRLRALLTKTGK